MKGLIILKVIMYCACFHLVYFTFNCVVVSITLTTNGDSVAGSEFNITATININVTIGILTPNITWLDSKGSTIENAWSGQQEFNLSGPVVATLDLVFSNLLLSQAGVYTFMAIITDTYFDDVTLQRIYEVTAQSECSFLLLFVCSVLIVVYFSRNQV